MTDDLTPEQQLDAAYRERAQLLAWLAALLPEGDAVLAPAPDVDEPGWRILYLHTRNNQFTWHIHPRDLDWFRHVPQVDASDDRASDDRAQWDGHSTAEKYARIDGLVATLWHRGGAECSEQHTYTGRCELAAGPESAEQPHLAPDPQPVPPEFFEDLHGTTARESDALHDWYASAEEPASCSPGGEESVPSRCHAPTPEAGR